MERYIPGDEVQVIGQGRGTILAVAKPGQNLDEICQPVLVHLGRLALCGKRFQLPTPNDEQCFQGMLTHYLVEFPDRTQWVAWHLTRRVRKALPGQDLAFMAWLKQQAQVESEAQAEWLSEAA